MNEFSIIYYNIVIWVKIIGALHKLSFPLVGFYLVLLFKEDLPVHV